MKNFTFIFLAAFSLLFSSCNRDEEVIQPNTVNLVGTWNLDAVIVVKNNSAVSQVISDCQKKSTLVFTSDNKAIETDYDVNTNTSACEVDFVANYPSYVYNPSSKTIKLNYSDGTSYDTYNVLEYMGNTMVISYSPDGGSIIVQKKMVRKL